MSFLSKMSFLPMRLVLIIGSFLLLPVFVYSFWHLSFPTSLSTLSDHYSTLGTSVEQNLQTTPTLPLIDTDETYQIQDTKIDGIDIKFASQAAQELNSSEAPKLSLSFPKDYSKSLEVKLDDTRVIPITDLSGTNDYQVDTLTNPTREEQTFLKRLFPAKKDTPQSYLRYQSEDGRKTLLYAYQKDQATGERKLKHWTFYQSGTGLEKEEYRIDQAKVRINENGDAEVYYFGDKELQNEQVKAEVDTNLMERAQKVLAKDLGEDIMNGGQTPDFTIPKPYYLDNQNQKHDLEWKWSEDSKTLSVSFSPESYPIALDPTLSFTAPGVSNGGSVVDGEASTNFGVAFAIGDLNTDGKADLIVGATTYSSSTGRAYIFYNDGSVSPLATNADIIITGNATGDTFGLSVGTGDFNADGRVDLAVGAPSYSTSTGRVYIFNNDGSIPTTAATADVTITGNATNNYFGGSLVSGDFNADGRVDLAVGAHVYSASTGRAYLFYNDGSIPTTAGTADVTITGEASSQFGASLAAGDLNADGWTDLAVGARIYSTSTGRAYIFYNDGSIPTTAATADVIITGNAGLDLFGYALVTGDLNADGKTDLAVGASGYSSSTGRAYIFYGDGSIPTTAATADVTITGGATSDQFGIALTSGDLNADGKTDLAVGASGYSSSTGRAYIFYNDGSIPTTAGTADVVITGESTSNYFGNVLTAGDLNADGRIDLVVCASEYSSSTGRVYVFYSQNGQVNTNQSITGGATGDEFGYALTTGDFNADGRTDLAVGANGYSSATGRAYIFYGDGQIPTTAGTADVTITGETTSNYFGRALTAGDFNADGKVDLAVGADGYSTSTGRVYIFHNDGSIPTTAATADVTITGDASGDIFGWALAAGDFNADGETDLAVGAYGYSTSTGRVYIFHNDGSIPTTAATADVTITGDASSDQFGYILASGDFNADSKTDLAVSAIGYSTNTGRVYIFHNDGSIPTTAATADVTITGDASGDDFGFALTAGDLNTDGKKDLVVGADGYSSSTGRVYIFHNDGSIPTTAATADVTITGGATGDGFGTALAAGDLNADGRTDLVVGAPYSGASDIGAAYIFYNDGSIPTTAGTADVMIAGVSGSTSFGYNFAVGDLNADGRTDLAVFLYGYASLTGQVYIYETHENFAWTLQKQVGSGSPRTNTNTSGQELKITGEATSSQFGFTMAVGDFNADGKVDLAVGAQAYSSNAGRVYLFYNDGNLPTGAKNADVVLDGASSTLFGSSILGGDFNADGKVDLAVGGEAYSTNTGRVYLFYNDGSYPNSVSGADVTITGETTSNFFGRSLAAADFNADGTVDLAVGAYGYSTNTGRVYVFNNDGSYTTAASSADAIMTGEGVSNLIGVSLTTGDFNNDGKMDLAAGASGNGGDDGKSYIFYGGSITTENATGADVGITGQTDSYFGSSMTAGDFNFDGKTDLAVGAYGYVSYQNTGRTYIFYGDGSIPTTAATADVTITGETTSNSFGARLTAGDFNGDGRTDLAVGAYQYSSSTGRAYIFYNDGSIPTTAATADLILTGEGTSNAFGLGITAGDINADGRTDLVVGAYTYSSSTGRVYIYTFGNDPVITGGATNNAFGGALASGDFNSDGRLDLAVGASGYSSNTGRTYIFYNDGAIPSTVANADVTITGNAVSDLFGCALTTGDFNTDGKIDLAVGAYGYSGGGNTGRAYIFYNDGSIPTTAGTADVTITGNAASDYFGITLTSGDLNADGKTDLVVGAYGYSSFIGRVYIFNNDGSIPTTAGTADVTITGESGGYFGYSLTTGDFDRSGTTDLAVGSIAYTSSTGRAYIFYNDGSIPTTAATADVKITGETTSNYFGYSVTAGDFNADGRVDLAVGAVTYSSNTGREYIFYNDGSIPTTAATADVTITGETTSNYFGSFPVADDFNGDGRTDLVVTAHGYSGSTGRAYVFYNDGSIPTTAATADVTITGEASSSQFGIVSKSGDFNADGKTDLVIGANNYSSSTGRVYIFTSEAANGTSTPPGTIKLKGTGKFKGTMKLK